MNRIPRVLTVICNAQSKFNQNTKKIIRNCDLTKKGKKQARKLEGEYDMIFVSPLKRCLQTLHYSKIIAPKIEVSSLIREFKEDPCDFFKDEEFKQENKRDVFKRINNFKEVINNLPVEYNKICVITHRDFIWNFTSYSRGGLGIFGYYLENADSIILIED